MSVLSDRYKISSPNQVRPTKRDLDGFLTLESRRGALEGGAGACAALIFLPRALSARLDDGGHGRSRPNGAHGGLWRASPGYPRRSQVTDANAPSHEPVAAKTT